ncbi:hypothetical protein [Mesorhizobium sp. YM1C-6-2]|uniref:hypothetical protein n=1 Tax=Mesorhizobium sp. YM1C-6-2 TaxID=1827501 RepID=UPI0016007C17|nr:hypothetical protein [Mesorhizobium sp. YM1C-6-2]
MIASEMDPKVLEAARWLVLGDHDNRRPAVPQLRERFGVNLHEAAAPSREAHLIRARTH